MLLVPMQATKALETSPVHGSVSQVSGLFPNQTRACWSGWGWFCTGCQLVESTAGAGWAGWFEWVYVGLVLETWSDHTMLVLLTLHVRN